MVTIFDRLNNDVLSYLRTSPHLAPGPSQAAFPVTLPA